MVRVVKEGPNAGSEIVTLDKLLGNGGRAPGAIQGNFSPIQTMSSAVDNIDKLVSLADRGVSLLGQVDRILQRVQTVKGPGGSPQAPQQGPGEINRLPSGSSRINSDPVILPSQEVISSIAPAPIVPAPAPGPLIDVLKIAEALMMIDKMQPGVTCAQLAESIHHNPAGVQNLVNVYLGAMKS